MKTNINHEREIRGIIEEASIEEIASGSLIPLMICDSNNIDKVLETIFCESISGGADYFNHMPKSLSLTKLCKRYNFETTGDLYKQVATYIQVDADKYPNTINEVNIYGKIGKLFIAAMAILSTELYTDKTPNDILHKVIKIAKEIENE